MIYALNPWTKHEDDLICILRAAEKTFPEISRIMKDRGLHRSIDAIKNRLKRIYKSPPKCNKLRYRNSF